MSDWLQGPYVYALYQHYGFNQAEIGTLFIAGFGSSMVFGTMVGSFGDKIGRRKTCLLFGVLYILSCVTKHYNSYNVLMLGRVLGGIATSLLFSSFESWMVSEHFSKGFSADLLGGTFAQVDSCFACFGVALANTSLVPSHSTSFNPFSPPCPKQQAYFGNSVIAIIAGLLGGWAAENFGFVAPFDCSMVCLVVGTIMVYSTWGENYGDSVTAFSEQLSKAVTTISTSKTVMMAGAAQSLFEGAMYTFVFMWTPAMESAAKYDGTHGFPFFSFED